MNGSTTCTVGFTIKHQSQITPNNISTEFCIRKAKELIHAYSCDPSYYQTALNELINHVGDRTIVVNAFINQFQNWQVNHQNKQNFFAFSYFFEKTCSSISLPWFYSRTSINNAFEKAKEKVPDNLILRCTEYCLTELHSKPSLQKFNSG